MEHDRAGLVTARCSGALFKEGDLCLLLVPLRVPAVSLPV
jgi:hypothetical protein